MSSQTNRFNQQVLAQSIRGAMLMLLSGAASFAYAADEIEQKSAVLPTVKVEAMS